MAHVILGLLLLADQSLYDLLKSFRAGVSLFYSASTGSIKRALDGLLERGLIEVASVETGSRGRKVYMATAAGHEAFHRWMGSSLDGSDGEIDMLSRLYFLGLVEPDKQPLVVTKILQRIASDLADLRALEEHLRRQDVPEKHQSVAVHQRATLAYGIASHQFALNWVTDRYGPG